MNGYYTINTGVYNFAVQHKQLLEVNNTKMRELTGIHIFTTKGI